MVLQADAKCARVLVRPCAHYPRAEFADSALGITRPARVACPGAPRLSQFALLGEIGCRGISRRFPHVSALVPPKLKALVSRRLHPKVEDMAHVEQPRFRRE